MKRIFLIAIIMILALVIFGCSINKEKERNSTNPAIAARYELAAQTPAPTPSPIPLPVTAEDFLAADYGYEISGVATLSDGTTLYPYMDYYFDDGEVVVVNELFVIDSEGQKQVKFRFNNERLVGLFVDSEDNIFGEGYKAIDRKGYFDYEYYGLCKIVNGKLMVVEKNIGTILYAEKDTITIYTGVIERYNLATGQRTVVNDFAGKPVKPDAFHRNFYRLNENQLIYVNPSNPQEMRIFDWHDDCAIKTSGDGRFALLYDGETGECNLLNMYNNLIIDFEFEHEAIESARATELLKFISLDNFYVHADEVILLYSYTETRVADTEYTRFYHTNLDGSNTKMATEIEHGIWSKDSIKVGGFIYYANRMVVYDDYPDKDFMWKMYRYNIETQELELLKTGEHSNNFESVLLVAGEERVLLYITPYFNETDEYIDVRSFIPVYIFENTPE